MISQESSINLSIGREIFGDTHVTEHSNAGTIIDAAEKRVRSASFPALSFRDIAQDVGVKSASVHYHFRKKEDSGEALIDNYTERFRINLEKIDRRDLNLAIDEFVSLYADGLIIDEAICMCAILGAEALGLPPSIKDRTKGFFEMNAL